MSRDYLSNNGYNLSGEEWIIETGIGREFKVGDIVRWSGDRYRKKGVIKGIHRNIFNENLPVYTVWIDYPNSDFSGVYMTNILTHARLYGDIEENLCHV